MPVALRLRRPWQRDHLEDDDDEEEVTNAVERARAAMYATRLTPAFDDDDNDLGGVHFSDNTYLSIGNMDSSKFKKK